MPKQATSPSRPSRKLTRAEPVPPKQPPALPRPGGKLGAIIDLLARPGGASATELMAETGWQRHSVLGGLSHLRARGFLMHLVDPDANGTRNYLLEVKVKRDAAS